MLVCKAFWKKIRFGAQRRRKIFFRKPAGPGLAGKQGVQKFASPKSLWQGIGTVKKGSRN
jgi:hypothetical protein